MNLPDTCETASSTDRALMPDLIRAFALVGIAVVNVMAFAFPLMEGFFGSALQTSADHAAVMGVSSLFLMKSYPLFSMMFGAGLAWQISAAARAGADASARYYRRMAALFVLGFFHFVFFWIGDILMAYGLLGCLLFTLRNASVRTLVSIGVGLLVLNTLILLLFASVMYAGEQLAPGAIAKAALEEDDAAQIAAFTNGSFLDAAAWRLSQFGTMLFTLLLQQGISVFGFFCFGLAAVKAGVIDQPQARIWRLSRWAFLPVGLAGSVWGASLLLSAGSLISSTFLMGTAMLMAFSPFAALGYVGVIALFSAGQSGPIRRFLARAGSASLTAYLLQSLALSLIFSAYGLGLFGRMTAAGAILMALLVAIASLVFTGIWRSYAARGPMEVLLRRITFWGRA